MLIGTKEHTYRWVDNWARIPETESGRRNGRTHGVAVATTGEVVVFHQASPAVLLFDAAGTLMRAWGDRYGGAHGLTLVRDQGVDSLWLTDQDSAAVVKTTLEGRTILELPRPEHPVYRTGPYAPTWVAVNEERLGGNGDVWVADGYGSNYVHRFDKRGNYLGAINGTEGKSGAFLCPHAIHFLNRSGEPELFIADRSNKRFQIYDPDGHYKREFGAGILECPCCCASSGEFLLVPELNARLTILDERDRLVGYAGENSDVCAAADWPNLPPERLQEGKFNSPHAIAVDAAGGVYIVEWIIGGRISKLLPC